MFPYSLAVWLFVLFVGLAQDEFLVVFELAVEASHVMVFDHPDLIADSRDEMLVVRDH